ncbi:MAG TPA: radical SAM protein [Candidatus Lokiarchaeia archaeon]|nr:radical SAM protein [Candidatus Lokiarchaeia archaeon]
MASLPARGSAGDFNAIIKDFKGADLRVGIICPAEFLAGKSHLAMQILYFLAHQFPSIACERIFLPPVSERRQGIFPRSRETGRPLREFDLLAVSLSFELEYPWFLWMLQQSGIPVFQQQRLEREGQYPFILLGGLAISANPTPLRDVAEAIFVGEADIAFHDILETCLVTPRTEWGGNTGFGKIPGILLPEQEGPVQRVWVQDLDQVPYPVAQIIPRELSKSERKRSASPLPDSFLLEVNRGCPNWCRFCLAGHFTRPFRNRSLSTLQKILEEGAPATPTKHVTLIGSAVADFPNLIDLLRFINTLGLEFSLPSVRLDQVDENLLEILRINGTRTLTIAPEAASEKTRRGAGKPWTNEEIIEVTRQISQAGIRKLKFYFLLGLPDSLESEGAEIPKLVKQIASVTHPNTRLEVSVNPFVPKAQTPLAQCVQYYVGEQFNLLHRTWRDLQRELRKIPRVSPEGYDPRWARIQALLSLAGKDVTPLLAAWAEEGVTLGGWSSVLRDHGWDASEHFEQLAATNDPEWRIVTTGVSAEILPAERTLMAAGKISSPCQQGCKRCGLCP